MITAQNIANKFWIANGNVCTFEGRRAYGVLMEVVPGVVAFALASNRGPASWRTKRTADEIARHVEGLVESGAYHWEAVYDSREAAADGQA